ncbi:MAG: excinuclease ABC subunit UvrC [Proteobacteria bacterium]|nr:excinuclease ABC subunit UvrC [Pseudomonadota bacterium]
MSNEEPNKAERSSRSPGKLPGAEEAFTYARFQRGTGLIKEHLKNMPSGPGVYRMISEKGEVLYVGKARNLKKRVSSYAQAGRLDQRQQRMIALTRALEFTLTHTEAEALLLEANLIRHHQPAFNILLLDDKSYPYILITRDHAFPQLMKYRGSRARKGWYYGPFASGEAVYETLGLLTRAFRLRNCADTIFNSRKRPCLQYHIKRCTAPCVAYVSKEEYAKQVEQAREFLAGKSDMLLKQLQKEMQESSEALNYEKAAELRDRIRMIAAIQSKQHVSLTDSMDADVSAIAREGGHIAIQMFFVRGGRHYGGRAHFLQADPEATEKEIMSSFLSQFYADKPAPKLILASHAPEDISVLATALSEKNKTRITVSVPTKGSRKALITMALKNAREALAQRLSGRQSQTKLLEDLARVFGLIDTPKRIEVFDNSHISGSEMVGAMIVAGLDGFTKKAYRKFIIRSTELTPGDDYGMMREVLKRRFARAIKEDPTRGGGQWPDLVLIDGGAGQVNAACDVLAELGLSNIPIAGIAKGLERNAGRERFFLPGKEPFSLEPKEPALYFLQRLRDEAHRFAIGFHRARRQKTMTQSPLDAIPNIGPLRKKKLLMHFGSAKEVSKAGLDDLRRVPGISEDLAKKIYGYFHEG